jgi:hypothetical protein
MNEKLQPLTLGEILDRTSQLYRHNFWTFAGVSAVPVVATFAVFVPFGIVMGLMGVFKAGQTVTDSGPFIALVVAALLIGLPVLLAASVVSQASLTRTAIDAHMGRKIKVREAIKTVWPRFWSYLWLEILQALLVGGIPAVVAVLVFSGAIALSAVAGSAGGAFGAFLTFVAFAAAFVYAIWRLLCYSMAIAACIVEEKTGWQSIKRSNLLSKGTRGRIFVMFLLVMAISIIISIIADIFGFIAIAISTALGASKYGPVVLVVGQVLNLLANFALQMLITPVSVIALTLFYFDQRVRKEGYDIELMMEQAGLTNPPAEMAPAAEPGLAAAPGITSVPESPLTPTFEQDAGPDTVKEQ